MIEPGPRTAAAKRRNVILGIVLTLAVSAILWTAFILAYLIFSGRI